MCNCIRKCSCKSSCRFSCKSRSYEWIYESITCRSYSICRRKYKPYYVVKKYKVCC